MQIACAGDRHWPVIASGQGVLRYWLIRPGEGFAVEKLAIGQHDRVADDIMRLAHRVGGVHRQHPGADGRVRHMQGLHTRPMPCVRRGENHVMLMAARRFRDGRQNGGRRGAGYDGHSDISALHVTAPVAVVAAF